MAGDEAKVKFGAETGEMNSAIRDASEVVSKGLAQMASAFEKLAGTSLQSSNTTAAATAKVAESTSKASAAIQSGISNISTTVKTGFNGITVGMGHLSSTFVTLTSLFAGGAAFKEVISSTTKWTSEVISLSKVLGISTQEASSFNVALRLIGKTSEDFEGIMFKLLRQIIANEEGINSLGVRTRDTSTGAFLAGTEVFKNAIDVLKEYKEGLDRDSAALYLFGRSAKEVVEYQKMNSDVVKLATQLAKAYNLEIGPEGAAKVKQYKMEMNAVGVLFEGIKVQIGTALLPTLMQLSGYLNEIGPSASEVFGNAIKIVIGIVDVLATTIRVAIAAIAAFAVTAVDYLQDVGKLASSTWDTYGNGEADGFDTSKARILAAKDVWRTYFNDIKGMAAGLDSRLTILSSPPPRLDVPAETKEGKGTKTWTTPAKPSEKGAKTGSSGSEDKSRVQIWRQELEEIQDLEESFGEGSKERELAFWTEKLAWAKKGSDEYRQVFHITAQLKKQLNKETSDEERKAFQESVKMQELELDARRKTALGAIELKEQEIAFRKDLGDISASEEIEGLKSLAERKYQIELQSLQERLALHELEAEERAKILEKIAELEQKQELRRRQLDNQAVLESRNRWSTVLGTISSAFEKSITGIIMGTTTLKAALSNIFQSILGEFVNLGVKMVVNWVARHAAMLAESLGWGVAEQATKAAAVAADAGIQIGANSATIVRDAGVTFAGVFANLAPFLGPMAAGPAAAAMAEVMAMLGTQIPAAAGGWEVPRDQLAMVHTNEVILPAAWSQRLKALTDNYQQPRSGSGRTLQMNISAVDARSFEQALQRSGSKLNQLIKKSYRDFSLRGE